MYNVTRICNSKGCFLCVKCPVVDCIISEVQPFQYGLEDSWNCLICICLLCLILDANKGKLCTLIVDLINASNGWATLVVRAYQSTG